MEILLIVLALIVLVPLGLVASAIRPDLPAAAVEKTYAGPASRFVEVEGLRMHLTDTGSGPPIVLIHGINASHRSFAGWIDELGSDHRLIAVDLPGHGLTGPDPQKRYTWAEMAQRVATATEALGIERFVLCGNSLGGAVSLEL